MGSSVNRQTELLDVGGFDLGRTSRSRAGFLESVEAVSGGGFRESWGSQNLTTRGVLSRLGLAMLGQKELVQKGSAQRAFVSVHPLYVWISPAHAKYTRCIGL